MNKIYTAANRQLICILGLLKYIINTIFAMNIGIIIAKMALLIK